MTIKVNTVEGKTSKKGTKQGRIYELTETKCSGWFDAGDASIWNVLGDWSKIGIMRHPSRRVSYTSDFEIIQP